MPTARIPGTLTARATIILPTGTYTNAIATTNEDANLNGDLDILNDVIIDGNGAGNTTIAGGGIDRVFHITGAFTVLLSNMTISGGSATGADEGGGIFNKKGALTLDAVTLEDNRAFDGGGGGIRTNGSGNSLTIRNGSVIRNNRSKFGGGGILKKSTGNLTITNSTFSGNWKTGSGNGGGLRFDGDGVANISESLFTNNYDNSGNGGAIVHSGGTMNITDTVFDASLGANSASADGGCIQSISTLTLNLTRVTMTGCTAGSEGGGLYVSAGTTNISNSNITNNTAGGSTFGGGINNAGGTVNVSGTNVLNNNTEDCVGTITDNGGNTDSDGTCLFARSTSTGNYTLTVYKTGAAPAGMGYVYSVPSGISCPGTCSAAFDDGTEVTLYTKNRNGMVFFRWEGACADVWRGDPCVLTVDGNKDIPVRFYPREPDESSDIWLVSPLNGSAGVPTTLLFIWWSLTDTDGDTITYEPMFCDGFESGDCAAWSAVVPRFAKQKQDRMFAGIGAMGGGFVLIGFLLGGGMRTRGGRALMLALFFVTVGFTAAACGSSDSGSDSSGSSDTAPSGEETAEVTCASVEEGQECLKVTNLEPNKNYYWKVSASDGNGGILDSDVWSFTTGE